MDQLKVDLLLENLSNLKLSGRGVGDVIILTGGEFKSVVDRIRGLERLSAALLRAVHEKKTPVYLKEPA